MALQSKRVQTGLNMFGAIKIYLSEYEQGRLTTAQLCSLLFMREINAMKAHDKKLHEMKYERR